MSCGLFTPRDLFAASERVRPWFTCCRPHWPVVFYATLPLYACEPATYRQHAIYGHVRQDAPGQACGHPDVRMRQSVRLHRLRWLATANLSLIHAIGTKSLFSFGRYRADCRMSVSQLHFLAPAVRQTRGWPHDCKATSCLVSARRLESSLTCWVGDTNASLSFI